MQTPLLFTLLGWSMQSNLYPFKVKSFLLSALFKKLSDGKLRQVYALQIDLKGLHFFENYGKGCYYHSNGRRCFFI